MPSCLHGWAVNLQLTANTAAWSPLVSKPGIISHLCFVKENAFTK